MTTPTFTVDGNWRRASSPVDSDLKAQPIAGTYALFALPNAPEPVRVARVRTSHCPTTTDAFDDLFSVTRRHATRQSRHDSRSSVGGDVPPPSYADTGLPAYSAAPNTEPATLAMYLFKFGFLFPPLWMLGALILISPLTAPPEFEPSKTGAEREALLQIIRDTELRWARSCAWALVALLVLASFVSAVTLGVLRSR